MFLFSILYLILIIYKKSIYVTAIKTDGPASKTDLKVNDKILQVSFFLKISINKNDKYII